MGKWDGKVEPKLLSLSANAVERTQSASFDYHKSNITSYAFCDENTKIKIFVEMKGVLERCPNEDDVKLEYTASSFQLTVKNYEMGEKCLCFGKLHAPIDSASCRKKKDKIIITLCKTEEKPWPRIGASKVGDDDLSEKIIAVLLSSFSLLNCGNT